MADHSVQEYCIAACRVPVDFAKDKLIKVLEDVSGARVTKVGVVEGAENDPNLEKVLLKLDSRKGATKLHEDVGCIEIEFDGNFHTLVFEKCLDIEIPLDWTDDIDGIEIDGDTDAKRPPNPVPKAKKAQPQQGQNIPPGQQPMFHPMYFQAPGFNPRVVPGFMQPGFPPNAGQMPRHQGQGQGTNPNTGQRFGLPPNFQAVPGFPPNMGKQYPFAMPGQMPQQSKGDNQRQNFADYRTEKVSPPPPYASEGQQEPMETDNRSHVKEKFRDIGDSQAVQDQDEQMEKLKETLAGQNYDNPERGNIDERGQTNKIVIKDLPVEADEEYIKLVFEMKQFGLHDVERIEIDRELNMALLEFDDTEAVDMIMKHPAPIVLKKSQVRVQPYFEIKEDPLPLCTIEVTGLDGFDVETFEMYFENKRKGGDAIEELQYIENEGRAFITYKTEDVARRVVERGNHVLSRQPLEVTLYQPPPKHRWNMRSPSPEPEPLPLDTVRVMGLGDSIDKDMLEMYFENERKCGGGDIQNIQMFGDVAYVTYYTEEVAQRVVNRGPHTLNKCRLEVSLCKPEDEDRQNSAEPHCTIKVSGFDEFTDKDTIEMYFEFTKRSSGGYIADMQFDEENRVAYITFCEADVAQRVVNRQHTLNRNLLQVMLHHPNRSPSSEQETEIEMRGDCPPIGAESIKKRSRGSDIEETGVDAGVMNVDYGSEEYNDNLEGGNIEERGQTNKIVIKDLPVEADEEYIKLVFEKKQFGSHDVEGIEIDRELNMALLVFDDTEAVDKIINYSEPIVLKKTQVRVQAYFEIKEESQPLCTIDVKGLDVLDVEFIEMYFENRGKGGDDIEELQYIENEGRAFITYKSEDVARRVVERGNHVLNRQPLEVTLYQPPPKHRWNMRTPSPEPESLPLDTVRVTGIGDSIDEYMLEVYFENERKSGGGDIQNIQMFGDVAYITFYTEEVAQRVVDNGPHTINRCKLEVSLGRPEDEDRRTYSRETSVEPQCTIQVSGFDETTDKDMLEMYFENTKRSSGGEIADIQLDDENRVAYITFCEENVAQRVVNREHTLNRNPLQVTIYRPNRSSSPEPEPEPITAIEVHGVGPSLDEEMIGMYFENEKKSGGSDIKDVRVDRYTGIAYVDYGSEEVAKRVVEKGDHQLNKRELKVTLHIQVNTNTKQKIRSLTTQKSHDTENTDYQPTETSVVKVKGVKRVTSLDTMRFYFENRRRSDGGDIADITHNDDDDDIVFITFEDPEAAKRVAGRQHSVDNQMLEVSLHIPPKPRPFFEDKILIKGLKDTVTQDGLFNFLEAKSGSVPTDFWRGEIEGVVIVTFENQPDFPELEEVCKRFPLEGGYLGVQRIQMTNCIIVLNVPDDTTKDTIQFYFENERRSNGGEIDKVVMRDEDGSCLVYFVDYRVVDSVLQKTHKLSEVNLIVKLYIDGFGCPGGEQIEATLKLPDMISITDVEFEKIKFMKNSQPNIQAIEMQMSCVNAEIIWPEKTGKEKDSLKQSILIKCTITKDTKNAKMLVKTWRKDAEESFYDFMKNILVDILHVSQVLWTAAMDNIKNFQIKYPERVVILVDMDQHIFSVVGLIPAVEQVSKDLRSMIKEIEGEAAKEKEGTKETITSLKFIETKMLLAEKFPSKMEQRFQDLKVKINQNRNEIVFDGSFGDVNGAKMLMYETKEDFASVSVDMKGSRSMFLLYENKPVKDYIVKKLKHHQVAAVWEVKDQKIVVCSTKEDTLDKSVEIVTKAVVEVSVGLSRENSEAIQAPAWRNVEKELAQRFPGKVSFDIQSSCIYVCSTDDISREVLGVVKRYLKFNTIIEEHVDFSRNINILIEKDHKDEIATISKKYASLNAQITPKADNSGFIIRGTEDGLQAMKRELESLKKRIHIKDRTLQSPGIKDHMKGKGRGHFTTVENKVPVVFSASDDSEPEYDELDNVSGPRVHAECRAYDDLKIYTAEGDMTELRVDVLVNTADSKLSLTGGLGKAIVAKGGIEVLKACKDYIRDEGELGEGEAFISPAGRLRARYVVHIVGPVWRGGTNNEETILAESVLKAMKKATVKNVKSVALPAISCGVYGTIYSEEDRKMLCGMQRMVKCRDRWL